MGSWLSKNQFGSVHLLSRIWLFLTPWTAARQASLSITNSRSLLKLMSIESVMPSNQLILCCPLLLLPPIFPSIRVFPNESALRIRWAKYWSFSFNISSSNAYLGLISFRMDWLGILAIPGTLKSLHQHHSSKASILQCSAFFIVQLSHPYVTTGKTRALIRQAFGGELLFNMLSLSQASKVILKILQARLQQFVNHELPDVQAGFRKGRGTRDQIPNICWITKKARVFRKNIYFCFIDYAKAFDCVDHNKQWKILKEMGILLLEKCVCRSGSNS